VRVDTHRATAEFAYEKWRDLSEPVYSIARPFDIVRLHLGVKILHGDARTAAAYAAMCEQLRAVNSRRDAHFDFTEQHSVEGLKPRMLLFPEDAHATPAWMCWQWYTVSVLTLTSWFYRIALEMKTVKVVYELQKQVFVAADATAA
jgi:TMEM151 family